MATMNLRDRNMERIKLLEMIFQCNQKLESISDAEIEFLEKCEIQVARDFVITDSFRKKLEELFSRLYIGLKLYEDEIIKNNSVKKDISPDPRMPNPFKFKKGL